MSAFGAVMVVFSLTSAQAEEVMASQKERLAVQSACAVAQTLNNRQQTVYFTQQLVAEGVQELAIIATDEQQANITKRITYHQHKTADCHFPAIAIIRAGDWGWFLAWADSEKAYYTRMDGEALVFAPPKILPVTQVTNIEFLSDSPQPTMRIQTQNGQSQDLTSDDEGRNWQLLSPQ